MIILYQSQKNNLMLKTAKSIRSKQSLIMQYTNKKQVTKYQTSIILFSGKAMQKKKAPGSP